MEMQNEGKIVGISIELSAIERQVAHTERRVEVRCPEYNLSNVHWKRVDNLLEQQDEVVKRLHEMNKTSSRTVKKVTQFLNQSSPKKEKLSSTVPSIPQEIIVDSDLNSNEGETEENGDNNEGETEENCGNQTDVSKRN